MKVTEGPGGWGGALLLLTLQFFLPFLEGTQQCQLGLAEEEESLAPARYHRAPAPALDCLPPIKLRGSAWCYGHRDRPWSRGAVLYDAGRIARPATRQEHLVSPPFMTLIFRFGQHPHRGGEGAHPPHRRLRASGLTCS